MANKLLGSKIATPYAEALFQLGIYLYSKEKNSDLFYQLVFDIQDLLKLFSEVPSLKEFLLNPLIPGQDKKNILKKCLREESNTLDFLQLLIDKKRIEYIENITTQFLEKVYNFLHIKFVEVWSVIELTQDQQNAIKLKINKMMKTIFSESYAKSAKIKLILRLDPNILGGLIIKMDSKIIDLSFKGELQSFAKELDVVL
jgi:F-type H+-transporting ATPase subunit delta